MGRVPDEYPIESVFDGAQWSRRVWSGHSKPASIPQNPRFWLRNADFRPGGNGIRFSPPPIRKLFIRNKLQVGHFRVPDENPRF